MSDMRSARHEMGKEVLAIFLLLMARACAFGVQYWPQLDDYIQYHNYALSESFWELQTSMGLLASRPLAGLADYFIWGSMYDYMILGVAMISLALAVSAVLLKRQLSRYFSIGPLFLVVMTLLPLGVEGTYWMSASTRVVCGLLMAVLAAEAFLRWMDTGRWYWALSFLFLQLLPYGFYEQSGVFSVALIVGMAILEVIRDWRRWKRALLSLWGLPAMKLYLEMTALLASDGVYSGRTETVTVNTPYWWDTFLPEVLDQMRSVFVEGMGATLFQGLARVFQWILSGQLLFWAFLTAALAVLCWRLFPKKEAGRGTLSPWLAIVAGVLLFLAPISIFFVLANPWFSFRGAVTSFAGMALVCDTAVMALWSRLPGRKQGPAVLATLAALIFCWAGAADIHDYCQTWETDQYIGQMTVQALQQDLEPEDNGRVGILAVEPTYLSNQTYYYHEHIHGCTESAWAFQGLMTSLDGSRSWNVTPLPTDPMYRQWNAASNRPDTFDHLYYFDGAELIPAVLEKEGETECSIYDQEGRLLGVVREEDGVGYFFRPEQLS